MTRKHRHALRSIGKPMSNCCNYRRLNGFTITELIVAMAIVAILIALSVQGYGKFKRHAARAKCIGNMRVVHSGLNACWMDRNRWPQMPGEALTFDESRYFEWWIRVLEPYGVGEESWLCPSDIVLEKLKGKRDVHAGSYLVTPFDGHQYSPVRWNQPWLMERGDFHGQGAHIAMPDGSILPSQMPSIR